MFDACWYDYYPFGFLRSDGVDYMEKLNFAETTMMMMVILSCHILNVATKPIFANISIFLNIYRFVECRFVKGIKV